MTSVDVERRLTEVLHRRAEQAMSRTDTERELRELLSRGSGEPPRTVRRKRFTAVAAAVTAAAAAVAVFWVADLAADRAAEPAPVQPPAVDPLQVTERFVAAYASNDAATVATLAAEEADLRRWRVAMARDEAWGVEFLLEPCRQMTTNRVGSGVLCPFSLHLLGSEELGVDRFENATFTVWVNEDGEVFDAEPTWNFERNGMGEHVGAVTSGVLKAHPDEADFLGLDEQAVPPAELDRWLGLWRTYIQEYVGARAKR